MSWCDPSVAKVRQKVTRKNPLFLAHCQVIVSFPVAVAAAVVAAGMVDRDPVALADAMTLVDAVIAGPVPAPVVPR